MSSNLPFDIASRNEAPETLRSTNYPSAATQQVKEPVREVTTTPSQSSVLPQGTSLYMNVDFPSYNMAGYESTLNVRKFGVIDLARIGVAKKSDNFVHLVNALQATVDGFDIRKMTNGDFDFLLYWHRINSLVSSRQTITWTSRYGNKNVTPLNNTNVEVTSLDQTPEVVQLQAMGYDFPRIADTIWRIEQMEAGTFSEEDEVIFQIAVWMRVDDPTDTKAKMAKARSLQDLSMYEGLDNWRKLAYHGVTDSVELADEHFNPSTVLDDLTRVLARADAIVSSGEFNDDFTTLLESILDEILELRALDQKGLLDQAKPRKETIGIPIDANSFFPVFL